MRLAQTLPHPSLRISRMAGHAERQPTSVFTARAGSPALTTAGLWDEKRDRATGEKHIHSKYFLVKECDETKLRLSRR